MNITESAADRGYTYKEWAKYSRYQEEIRNFKTSDVVKTAAIALVIIASVSALIIVTSSSLALLPCFLGMAGAGAVIIIVPKALDALVKYDVISIPTNQMIKTAIRVCSYATIIGLSMVAGTTGPIIGGLVLGVLGILTIIDLVHNVRLFRYEKDLETLGYDAVTKIIERDVQLIPADFS